MKHFLFTLVLVLATVAAVAAPKQKKTQAKKTDITNTFGKGKGTVYIFGVGQMLTDEDVYITGVCQVDSIDLEKKTKFLPFRYEFSIQMKEYLEGKLGLHKQTVSVFFSANRNKISKKFYKVKKRYLDNPDRKVHMVDEKAFEFKHPLDSNIVDE